MDIQQSTTQTEPAIISPEAQPVVKKPLQGLSGWLILPVIGLFYMWRIQVRSATLSRLS
ncbi:hypothetical protein AB7351_11475 [Providencia rettgeri]